MAQGNYVLITPARNEEAHIGKVLEAIIVQTALPRRWVIVSDASSDRTDAIVQDYAARHDCIRLLRIEDDAKRNFASQVYAIDAGYDAVQDLDYEYMGLLDADIVVGPDYYERMLAAFAEDPKLGIAGGLVLDVHKGQIFNPRADNLEHVAGGVQMFRRQCYADAGGYLPLRYGGMDVVAEVEARRKGWRVQTFDTIQVHHLRLTGYGEGGLIKPKYRDGLRQYLVGHHPLFIIAKCAKRTRERPYVIGSLATLTGFFVPWLLRRQKAVPAEHAAYVRKEQWKRLKALLK